MGVCDSRECHGDGPSRVVLSLYQRWHDSPQNTLIRAEYMNRLKALDAANAQRGIAASEPTTAFLPHPHPRPHPSSSASPPSPSTALHTAESRLFTAAERNLMLEALDALYRMEFEPRLIGGNGSGSAGCGHDGSARLCGIDSVSHVGTNHWHFGLHCVPAKSDGGAAVLGTHTLWCARKSGEGIWVFCTWLTATPTLPAAADVDAAQCHGVSADCMFAAASPTASTSTSTSSAAATTAAAAEQEQKCAPIPAPLHIPGAASISAAATAASPVSDDSPAVPLKQPHLWPYAV